MASNDPRALVLPYRIWWRLFRELRRRGGDVRESGAFLLGWSGGRSGTVTALAFYDDIDPGALSTGIVRLSGHAMNGVWETCSEQGLAVLADIHTHPGGAGQSASDREHPMVSMRGHLALIAPNFGRSPFDLAGVGVYRYAGSKRWENLLPPRLGWRGIIIRGAR